MAVMYSKLGGCLGVTTKLGPLARTGLWTGVKGLLERFMTHLGLGSSLEEPWECLAGGVVGLLPSQQVVFTSWEAWVGLCLGGHLLPCLRVLFGLLAWPAWVLGGLGGLLPSDEGRRALAWEGEEVIAWERLLSSPGGIAPAWGGVPPSPSLTVGLWGGQRSASFSVGRNCLGRPVVFPGGRRGQGRKRSSPGLSSPQGRQQVFPGSSSPQRS